MNNSQKQSEFAYRTPEEFDEATQAFGAFVQTIETLRAPGGCPWDREQTHVSIANNMIEEAYEAVDTIEQNDVAHMREELGDVLLQVVLQSQIAAEAGEFTITDVCNDVNEKIIHRHPHVFGSVQAPDDANEVLALWDQVKLADRAAKNAEAFEAGSAKAQPEGLLDGVPVSFPALMQAQKISRKAAAAGFEWNSLADVWDKVNEEIAELNEAYEAAPKGAKGKVESANPVKEEVELEFGDVLFSLVNVARWMGVNSETALRASCNKFRRRWEYMEQRAAAQGKQIQECTMEELQLWWDTAKQ